MMDLKPFVFRGQGNPRIENANKILIYFSNIAYTAELRYVEVVGTQKNTST